MFELVHEYIVTVVSVITVFYLTKPMILPIAMVFPSSRSVTRPNEENESNVSMQVLMGRVRWAMHCCPCRANGRFICFPLSMTATNKEQTHSISTVCTCITDS